MAMPEPNSRPALALWLASLLALLWIGYCLWMAGLGSDGFEIHAFLAPESLAIVAAPVAAVYALAAALRGRQAAPMLVPPDSLAETESQLSALAGRLQSLRQSLSGEVESIVRLNAALGPQSASARELVQELRAAAAGIDSAQQAVQTIIPDASRTVEALIAAFAEVADQAGAKAEQLQSTTHDLTGEMAALDQQSTATATAMAAMRQQSDTAMRAIRSEADSLFAVLENTLVAKRQALVDESGKLIDNLRESYGQFQSIAQQSLAQLTAEIAALTTATATIDGRLQKAATDSRSLLQEGSDQLATIAAAMRQSLDHHRQQMVALGEDAATARQKLDGIAAPIDAAQQALDSLGNNFPALQQAAAALQQTVGEGLQPQLGESSRSLGELETQTAATQQTIEALAESIRNLASPLDDKRQHLDEATMAYTAQREAVEATSQNIIDSLQQSRSLLEGIETQARSSALDAASALVDTFTRLRDTASQSAGTLKQTFDDLTREARASLQQAADDALKRSFVAPIAHYAEQAEQRAATAAERTASSMAALAEALRLIDERIRHSHTRLTAADEQDLAQSAGYLMEEISRAATGISEALGQPMRDADWQQWQKGERGLFSQRAHALLSRRERSEIAAMMASDDRLAREARNYVVAFDTLLERFQQSVPGLAAALRGSEQGRLAAILAEVMDAHQL